MLVIIIMLSLRWQSGLAQAVSIIWSRPINLSNTADKNSTNPYLLADPAGAAHLFWAEKVGNDPTNQPDTVMYTSWNGIEWTKPLDIFFAPISDGNPIIAYPNAVLDDQGFIHLVWLSQPNAPNYAVNYSKVHVSQSYSTKNWQPRRALASDLTGTKYSVALAIDSLQVLHLAYARVPQGDKPGADRAVTYIRSSNRGETWSEPIDIWTTSDIGRGASDIRMVVDKDGEVYVAWTEWDQSGNGQAIVFGASYDNGLTWQPAIRLTERRGIEYERDWNNLTILGDGSLVSMWEGGYRAYRYATYSYDKGKTWSEPTDTFPWLIGENGFAQFFQDGAGRTHLIFSQRIREGILNRPGDGGLWHSVWEGGQRWSEPVIAWGPIPALNPTVALVQGNTVMLAWHSGTDFEVRVMTGIIESTPRLPAVPWSTDFSLVSPTPSVESTQDALVTPVMPTLIATAEGPLSPIGAGDENLPLLYLAFVFPALLVFSIVIILVLRRNP